MSIEDYAEKAIRIALDAGSQYCDVRAESVKTEGFVIENGEIENFVLSYDSGLGIRVLVNGSWGFYSVSEPKSFDGIKQNIVDTVKATKYYSEYKKYKVRLAEVRSFVDDVRFNVLVDPNIDELMKLGLESDKTIRDKKRIIKSSVSIHHDKFHKYFVNSEGSKITQNFDDMIANMSATAHCSGLTESVSTTEGGRGGLEMLTGKNDILAVSQSLSEKADALLDAKTVKEEQSTVVMNPDFVALLSHEILGHPSEADRVLGKEMAWAGGAWWAGKLGTKIGSSELNVIDDPTIPSSLGWYKYDDEGVPATKKLLIEDGILCNHMHSRETASMFDATPNSSMRSTGYSFMPLVRMACTCISPGNWDPAEMIRDVKNGFLICNMKIPSIDMMRYNWSISCQYAQKIENGELGDLLRDVIVMGNAPEFFGSIDARGKDFQVRPITNCGKGDPMQIMRMGNGGPHIRGKSIVKSVVT
ncbi:MAG: TldD/PmbA family protein [Thaumarchaeota archaeon]|nr:TldD/PmbA family protein [Nitrososphaerota archaeon]MDE1830756.1 TldD/PmbA family protein [Nitrososphaerota archaeon]MDE1840806.1 TldD/PmbA family protein [Nitrososphaerota archaeon]MDE1877018.1 TldD/PmbA family protein [Nitrososphaerota archaeon]